MLRNAIGLLFFAVAGLALGAGDIDLSRTREVLGLTISTNGDNVTLAWNPVPDATAYKVYSCGTPDGVFTEDLNGVFAGASWTTSEAASCRFYYVTALTQSDNMFFVEGGTIYPTAGIYTDGLSVSGFYIGKYEITNSEWNAVMGTGESDTYPHGDTWCYIIVYCNRRSIQEGFSPCYSHTTYGTNPDDWPPWFLIYGQDHNISCDWSATGYRLPSDAEWEFAARGGLNTNGCTYSGSNDLNEVGWYFGNSGYAVHQVGQLAPNELGAFDMSGNFWEWCWDEFGTNSRVIRGGYFGNSHAECAVSYRSGAGPGKYGNIGFRVCRTSP
ncbi:MAG: formylglycine-generating enzyme family protein [Candidatus Cloacimonetes bacterium]|nr:formylglycine-generating enzyme family protein [Candidatus Cloacimonadota bacterium]